MPRFEIHLLLTLALFTSLGCVSFLPFSDEQQEMAGERSAHEDRYTPGAMKLVVPSVTSLGPGVIAERVITPWKRLDMGLPFKRMMWLKLFRNGHLYAVYPVYRGWDMDGDGAAEMTESFNKQGKVKRIDYDFDYDGRTDAFFDVDSQEYYFSSE